MTRSPQIFLTNDDGVSAPGLAALARALRPVGEVTVIAPEHNWSAGGHSKTMHKPLRVSPARLADGEPALAGSGSPSDCVALALLGLLEAPPDLVISGINTGANVGSDLTYSGTVSAAMEAVLSGVPGVAVSIDATLPGDYGPAAAFVAVLAAQLLAEPAGRPPRLLNVNVRICPVRPCAAYRSPGGAPGLSRRLSPARIPAARLL
jgi:5'-nucleotidase